MKSRTNKGFTLIELIIVVVVVGILAGLAIPRFMRSAAKARQTEAIHTLKQIQAGRKSYNQKCNEYCLAGVIASAEAPNAFDQICVTLEPKARYTYEMRVNSTGYTCVARANIDDDKTIDQWEISSGDTLKCVTNDVDM